MLYKQITTGKPTTTIKRAFICTVLLVLFASQAVSNYLTIREVNASFSTETNRGEIKLPNSDEEDQSDILHIDAQTNLANTNSSEMQTKITVRERADRIRDFYSRWNAPMASSADYIVEVSDNFGLDWRLIPAISVIESSGGNYCFRSYNAFGWGKMGFSSYEQAIYTVANGLANSYGTSNPYHIAPRYNPVTPDAWASKVASSMNQI
ncbi:MAG: hypothetical protein U9Q67_01790 [Patescibacteria group bacterium]|nr:hypothetical protein [Patescibacteria group bacterium]